VFRTSRLRPAVAGYGPPMRGELASTWPTNDLLPTIRHALSDAQDALLCVAFVNRRGIGLLEPQLAGLAHRCRLLVTSTFGGDTTGTALAAATELRVQVRVLNPPAGTFHSKLYLTHGHAVSVAVVGSPNLTSGLAVNIETALVVTGSAADKPIADCWQLAESLWTHPAARDWNPTTIPVPDERFDPQLLAMLRRASPPGSVITTITEGRPNTIADITPDGVYVQTGRSRARGTGPQLVPAWMVQLAWDYLQRYGELTNRHLLAEDGLNVKRSSAVCALLAQLPDVDTASTRPVVLRLRR
jgi:HKD family nuclease